MYGKGAWERRRTLAWSPRANTSDASEGPKHSKWFVVCRGPLEIGHINARPPSASYLKPSLIGVADMLECQEHCQGCSRSGMPHAMV